MKNAIPDVFDHTRDTFHCSYQYTGLPHRRPLSKIKNLLEVFLKFINGTNLLHKLVDRSLLRPDGKIQAIPVAAILSRTCPRSRQYHYERRQYRWLLMKNL